MQKIVTAPEGVGKALKTNRQTPLAAEDRLEVYAYAYFARIIESLADDFPITERLLGKRAFRALLADYLKKFPSRSYTLSDAGSSMPRFIKRHPLLKTHPALADLAQMEWALMKASSARDARGFDPANLQALAPGQIEKLPLRLESSVTLLRSPWAIHELRGARRKRKVRRGTSSILIYRNGFRLQVESLDPTAFQVLQWISKGMTLGTICRRLSSKRTRSGSAVEALFFEWFSKWTSSGVISLFAEHQ